MKKRFFSVVLSLAMVLAMFPATAFAAGTEDFSAEDTLNTIMGVDYEGLFNVLMSADYEGI